MDPRSSMIGSGLRQRPSRRGFAKNECRDSYGSIRMDGLAIESTVSVSFGQRVTRASRTTNETSNWMLAQADDDSVEFLVDEPAANAPGALLRGGQGIPRIPSLKAEDQDQDPLPWERATLAARRGLSLGQIWALAPFVCLHWTVRSRPRTKVGGQLVFLSGCCSVLVSNGLGVPRSTNKTGGSVHKDTSVV